MSYSELTISQYVVAAICGCWWRESNCNPELWESRIPCAWDYEYEYTHRGGYGLGQWTNTEDNGGHGRLWRMHEWVTSNGYQDGDGFGQLEYLLVEDVWYRNNPSKLHYTSLTDFLQSDSTDIDKLVYDFLSQWEGVPNDHYQERCRYAREILAFIIAHANDGEIYEWISMNNYLSANQIKNNAMVIFQYVNGQIAPIRSNKMPLWMMIRKRNYMFK